MASFLGEFPCKVDVKGRIILPMAFKKQMPADAQDRFVVKKDTHEDCLVLYSMDDWNSTLEKIRKKLNPFNRDHNRFRRNYYMGTAELTLDSNNRILIPKRLMDLIEAGRDVILEGQDGKIELWPAEKYKNIAMPADDYVKLSDELLGGSNNDF